jgi:hypothetical protein
LARGPSECALTIHLTCMECSFTYSAIFPNPFTIATKSTGGELACVLSLVPFC